MKRKELKLYTSSEIEDIDYNLLVASEDGTIKMTRVYIASEADSVMDAYEARIKELEAKISMLETTQKWISVNDMLPPKNKDIIGCTIKGNVMPCWFSDYARTHLSHWMPLPQPPTEESSATEKENR